MNVRLKLKDKLNGKQKDRVKEYAKEIYLKEATDNARRLVKIFCVALNQRFGFGHDRLAVL